MRTPEEYKESLRQMRPNVYKFGRLIEDVTTHPSTRRSIEGHAKIYWAAHVEEYRDLVSKLSILTSKRTSRYLSLITSPEDMIANVRLKRLMFNLTGTCTGGRCVGWNALNTMWAVTYDIDRQEGTDYHSRLRRWLEMAQHEDLAVCGAMTDPKGNRTKRPSEQTDPDMHLRMVDRGSKGIVVRGAKVMIAGASASNEVFVLPGGSYGEDDAPYAISFVVPRDATGITVIEARHPSDGRDFEDGADNPVKTGGITQGYILFDDVPVPEDRVFMAGEWQFTREVIQRFIGPYRSAMGGCVAGQGDLMVGASLLLTRAHGLNEKVFREKITQMCINNETTFGMGIAAAVLGEPHPSGVWTCDSLIANVNKVHVSTLPYETKRLAQEIAGGIGETGCMPSWRDLEDAKYGMLLRKYLSSEVDGEVRAKLARFIEWLTIGAGLPGTMHGGGSPEGARIFIRSETDFKRLTSLVKELIGIEM